MNLEQHKAHTELMQYQILKKGIKPKQDKLDEKWKNVNRYSGGILKLPSGGTPKGMDDKISEFLDLKAKWQDELLKAELVCEKLKSDINLIDKPFERLVLELYYCLGKAMVEIAAITGLSYEGVKYHRCNGLTTFYEKYLKNSKDYPQLPIGL